MSLSVILTYRMDTKEFHRRAKACKGARLLGLIYAVAGRWHDVVKEEAPVYNVWNFGNCDPRFGQKHPLMDDDGPRCC